MLLEILLVFGCSVTVTTYSLRYVSKRSIELGILSSTQNTNYTVCNTEECRTLANLIINGMNKSVDPCEDFYSYVCGSWPKNFMIPADQYIWSFTNIVRNKILTFQKKILQEEPKPNDSVPLTMEKKWIKACMDEDRIEEKGLEPLINIIEKIGGWPMTMSYNSWKMKEVAWQKVAQYYAKIVGRYNLFNIVVIPDILVNSSFKSLQISPPMENSLIPTLPLGRKEEDFSNSQSNDNNFLGKDRDYVYNANVDVNNNETKNERADYIQNLVYAYVEATNVKPANVSTHIAELIDFEESIKKISLLEENNTLTIDLVEKTIDEFQEYYNLEKSAEGATSRINWLKMIQLLFEGTDIKINGSQTIVVCKEFYFHKLAQVLSRTPNRVLVNYIHWSFFHDISKYLNRNTRRWITDKKNSEFGIKEEPERLAVCVKRMPIYQGISYEFVKAYFSNTTKQNIADTFEEIRNEIDHEIAQISSLNNEIKSFVRKKLEEIEIKIGYPNWFEEEAKFNAFYSGLDVGPDYFVNVMNYLKWKTSINFRNPSNNEDWFVPVESNAYYFPPNNKLYYLAGMLLSPLYNPKAPMAVHYGSVGFVIGHEISHAVSSEYFFLNVNSLDDIPISRNGITEHLKRVQCFIDQYSKYKVDGLKTVEENMADAGGLKASFEVYTKKIDKEKIEDTKLPGLEDIDGKQLFFISFASTFCEIATPEYLKIENDAHSSTPVRVNGALFNIDGFSEAFQCSKSSLINSEKKCYLWK